MTPEQALKLYRAINTGPSVGVDADGSVVHNATDLGLMMDLLDAPTYVAFCRTDNSFTPPKKLFAVDKQVAFLRKWADALEQLGGK